MLALPRLAAAQQRYQLLVCLLPQRHFASASLEIKPAPVRLQLKPPTNEKGVMHYERLYSRDDRYAPQPGHKYDTPKRFFLVSIKKYWEIWPLLACLGAWFVGACFVIYWSFSKLEIQLNRNDRRITLDWERVRDSYWKYPTRLYDPSGRMNSSRIPIMEVLQDEMLEAAKQRGTRD